MNFFPYICSGTSWTVVLPAAPYRISRTDANRQCSEIGANHGYVRFPRNFRSAGMCAQATLESVDHCVQGTPGAEFHPALDVPHAELIVRKGCRKEIDAYSAFLENDHVTPTGLAGYLRDHGIRRLFLCGLAYDYCVRHSAIDGIAHDFECFVIEDACRAVGGADGRDRHAGEHERPACGGESRDGHPVRHGQSLRSRVEAGRRPLDARPSDSPRARGDRLPSSSLQR